MLKHHLMVALIGAIVLCSTTVPIWRIRLRRAAERATSFWTV